MLKIRKYRFWDKKRRVWTRDSASLICTDGITFELETKNDHIEIIECVGKKDRNEQDIYDGYILRYESKEYPDECGIYLIQSNEEDCSFDCEKDYPYNYLLPEIWCQCEIIGNRFENPELLE